jgi:phosphoenolpyruvate carboxykinase (GTP)
MVERIRGTGRADETPIGAIPSADALDLDGLTIRPEQLREALHVDAAEWRENLANLDGFYAEFGSRLPATLKETLARTRREFGD